MNTMNYYIFLILGSAAMLQSCSQDDELSAYTKKNGELTIIATTDGFTPTDNVQTRATDNGYATSFSNGGKIGIIATLNGSVVVNNVACTYNGGQWTDDVLHKNSATYLVYYPYRESMNDKKSVEEVVSAFNVSTAMLWVPGRNGCPHMAGATLLQRASSLPRHWNRRH